VGARDVGEVELLEQHLEVGLGRVD